MLVSTKSNIPNFRVIGSRGMQFPSCFCAADTGLGLFSVNVFMRLREQKVNFTLKKNPKYFSLNSCKNQNKLSVTEILTKSYLHLAFFGTEWFIHSMIRKFPSPGVYFWYFWWAINRQVNQPYAARFSTSNSHKDELNFMSQFSGSRGVEGL